MQRLWALRLLDREMPEIKVTRANVIKLKKIIDMPMIDKINMINSYIDSNSIDEDHLTIEDIGEHLGSESIVNTIMFKITRPHAI